MKNYLNISCLVTAVALVVLSLGCTATSTERPKSISISQTGLLKYPFVLRVEWDEIIRFNPHTLSYTRSVDHLVTYIFLKRRLGPNTDGDFVMNYVNDPGNPRKTKGKIVLTLNSVTIDAQIGVPRGFTTEIEFYQPFSFNGEYHLVDDSTNPLR